MSLEAAQILEKIESKPEPTQNTGEGAATDGPPLPIQDNKVSGKLEILIKREQQAIARERQARERESSLEAKLKAIEEREGKLNEFETKKKNPKEALGLLGLTYDELTQAQLNDGELPPQVEIKKLREEIEAYKQAQTQEKDHEKERALAEAKAQAEAQEKKAIESFRSDINQYLTDNSARYELIQYDHNQDLVFDIIDEHYNRTQAHAQKQFELGEITQDLVVGKVMSIKEAADKVEEYLEQKYNKAKELSKIKALWGAIPKETQKILAKPELNKPNQTPPKTLTNQLSASASAPKQAKMLSDQERVQKAIAYARGLRPQ